MGDNETRYPLAPQGVFRTLNGEGYFSGLPMVFVRLGGCPVGCPSCDTDYSVVRRASSCDIAREAAVVAGNAEWAWVTGGEPAVFDLKPLFRCLRKAGLRIAVATSGIREVPLGKTHGGADFVSVSPHRLDDSWVQRRGDQVNLVFGLNGLTVADAERADAAGWFEHFSHRYATPCWYHPTDSPDPASVRDVTAWVDAHAGWRRGEQNHKRWGVA